MKLEDWSHYVNRIHQLERVLTETLNQKDFDAAFNAVRAIETNCTYVRTWIAEAQHGNQA